VIEPASAVDLQGLLFFQIVHLNPHGLVNEDNFFAVGRPPGAGSEIPGQASSKSARRLNHLRVEWSAHIRLNGR